MAMKEIRLELDNSKLNGIIMELDILHRAVAPEIVEFYGAFFVESCVYYCMEYMDAGSMDRLQHAGVPEPVLGRVMQAMVRGLKFLKDELQIMHRDVKPTNVLVSRAGAVKLCDFGVSGQLEKSLAKTNIGCQSYMAPERIQGESTGSLGAYTVSSDVWSLGLTAIEMAVGHYPFPPETYSNVFAQLQAIVHGDPPSLPDVGYSDQARDFVARCLEKAPAQRATYAELLVRICGLHGCERHTDRHPHRSTPSSSRTAQEKSTCRPGSSRRLLRARRRTPRRTHEARHAWRMSPQHLRRSHQSRRRTRNAHPVYMYHPHLVPELRPPMCTPKSGGRWRGPLLHLLP
jgi:mitogen-activated protein kinase kinase